MTASSGDASRTSSSDAGTARRGKPQTEKAHGWRRWTPWVLIVLAAVIALVASLNIWVKRQALSTDHWTEASSRLLENDDIRNAISVYLVNQLYENVDVSAELQKRLPAQTKPLAPPIAAALEPALVRVTDDLLGRPRVQKLWQQANRRAHQLFMAVLNGKNGILETSGGNVVLNLRPILEQIAAQTGIGSRLEARLPADAGQIVVMKGTQLDTARKGVKVVRALSYLLSFLVLALFAAAIYIARGRRRTMLMASGGSLLVVGLIVLVVRRLAGRYIVDTLTTNPDAKHPVSAAWGIGTELLRNVGINVVIYGLIAMFAAWIVGPSRPAVWIRRHSAPTLRDYPWLVYGLLTLVLLLVLIAGPTDGERIYPLLVLFALAYAGMEFLRRQTAREFPQTEQPGVPAVTA